MSALSMPSRNSYSNASRAPTTAAVTSSGSPKPGTFERNTAKTPGSSPNVALDPSAAMLIGAAWLVEEPIQIDRHGQGRARPRQAPPSRRSRIQRSMDALTDDTSLLIDPPQFEFLRRSLLGTQQVRYRKHRKNIAERPACCDEREKFCSRARNDSAVLFRARTRCDAERECSAGRGKTLVKSTAGAAGWPQRRCHIRRWAARSDHRGRASTCRARAAYRSLLLA